jgi:hypothetical protein
VGAKIISFSFRLFSLPLFCFKESYHKHSTDACEDLWPLSGRSYFIFALQETLSRCGKVKK